MALDPGQWWPNWGRRRRTNFFSYSAHVPEEITRGGSATQYTPNVAVFYNNFETILLAKALQLLPVGSLAWRAGYLNT